MQSFIINVQLFALTALRLGPTRFCRSLMKDHAAVRASLEKILSWDFDRIVVGHGRNLEPNGKAVLRDAFAFLSSE
jgi:hypothetical protein